VRAGAVGGAEGNEARADGREARNQEVIINHDIAEEGIAAGDIQQPISEAQRDVDRFGEGIGRTVGLEEAEERVGAHGRAMAWIESPADGVVLDLKSGGGRAGVGSKGDVQAIAPTGGAAGVLDGRLGS